MNDLHHSRPSARRAALRILCALTSVVLVACSDQAEPASQGNTPGSTRGSVSTDPDLVSIDVPAELKFVWIGDNRSVPALSDDERLSSIFGIGAEPEASEPAAIRLSFFGELPSRISQLSADRMTLVITDDGAGCQAGDSGTYRWSLSPAGDELRLDLDDDACATRAAALPGTWTRSDCPLFPEDFCLGDLEPGAHRSSFFDPFATPDEWRYNRGVLTYTVPAGWANTGDYPDEYSIQPQGRSGDVGIYMWSEVAIAAADAPCSIEPDPEFARTPDAFAGWLTAHPGLVATNPVPFSVGGLDGLMLDASVADGAALPCVGDGRRYLPMLVHSRATGLQWGFHPMNFKRFYLLDLSDGRSLVISIEAEDEQTFDALLPEAAAIVASMRFEKGIAGANLTLSWCV